MMRPLAIILLCLVVYISTEGCGRNWLPKPPPLPTKDDGNAWGGNNPNKWRGEAIIANAASKFLNMFWMLSSDINDVFISIPTQILNGGDRPHCDGQTTASPWFAQWPYSEPPIVSALIHYKISKKSNHQPSIGFVFHKQLDFSGGFTVQYLSNGTKTTKELNAYKTPEGWSKFDWSPAPPELDLLEYPIKETILLLRLKGHYDWFPIRFHMPIHTVDMVRNAIPKEQHRYSDGTNLLDREDVGFKLNVVPKQDIPYNLLQKKNNELIARGYENKTQDAYSKFPTGRRVRTTSVGSSWDLMLKNPVDSLISSTYSCLEARREDQENQFGVPSGSGWHRIGDRAVTLLNNLEEQAMLIGIGSSNPFPWPLLESGDFAYGLSDTVCIRWLMPGEAVLLRRGGSWSNGKHALDQSNYRWYSNPFKSNFCMEQWINKCDLSGDYMIQASCEKDSRREYCTM